MNLFRRLVFRLGVLLLGLSEKMVNFGDPDYLQGVFGGEDEPSDLFPWRDEEPIREKCVECGIEAEVEAGWLRKIEHYCPKCAEKVPGNPFKSKGGRRA